MGLEFGRIAFSSHIPSCHSPVSSIPQLPQLVRRGKLLHSGRASSHGFVEQLKLTPFYFCINGPLAIAQFRLFCSSLDSCLCNPTGFKWPPSQLEVIFVPVFLLDTCILLTVLFKSKKKKNLKNYLSVPFSGCIGTISTIIYCLIASKIVKSLNA